MPDVYEALAAYESATSDEEKLVAADKLAEAIRIYRVRSNPRAGGGHGFGEEE